MKKNKIIVVGSGTAGLMFSSYIKTILPEIQVDIYYDINKKPLLVGESTQPFLMYFCDVVFGEDVNNWNWLNTCNATYKFYVEHHNWNYDGHKWIYPFYHDEYNSLISKEDHENKLFLYNKNNVPPKELYAYHLQSAKLQPLLLNKCKKLGVNIIESDFDFKNIKSDEYVIDCRGFHGQETNRDISPAIVNDYAIAGHIPFQEERYYTKTIARSVGWNWEIPLQNLLGVGRVFSTKYLSIKDAKKEMYDWYGLETFYEVPFKSKYNETPCTVSSLKIGSSAVFIEPLESTTLMLVIFMTKTFIDLFKSCQFNIDADFCDAYNKGYQEMVKGQICYIEGFYCLSDRSDSSYWRDVSSNYNWYMDKLENEGWPAFFGKYGFEKFFGSFNKLDKVKHIETK